jgi:co-chaperonin GroES (HSP10)
MPIDVKPVGFRVLVEQLENRSVGNIQLPENAKESVFCRFKVVAVGEPRIAANGREVPIPVKVGDEVMFDMKKCVACGPPTFFGGRTLALVEGDGILAVMDGETPVHCPRSCGPSASPFWRSSE